MPKRRKRRQSGATGGPATGAGLNYQVDFAILHALHGMSHALVNPLEPVEISMEPRVVTHAGNSVTRWDVRTSHPDKASEAKLRPKRQEILDWLDQVELGLKQSERREFQLFYGRGAGAVIGAIERLRQLATEAKGDPEKFRVLVDLERTNEFGLILERLSTNPHVSLLRVHVTAFDPARLKQDIEFRLRLLTREPHRQQLYELLFSNLHRGIEQRMSFKIRDLIEEAQAAGIELFPPPTFETRDLPPLIAGVVFILQNCEGALPTEALARALSCTAGTLKNCLVPYVDRRVLFHEKDLWAIAPFRPHLSYHQGSLLVERTVRQLLEYIRSNRQNPLGWSQVPNVIALAKVCQTDYPELVACLFLNLDKLLKRTGNKRLVLEVANLSITCSHRQPRTELQAKGEAVALVCGRSWVYQRTNRLEEARAEANKSLKLGDKIGWTRNTAYCLKCIGRLFRMEAEEQISNKSRRDEYLQSSIESIQEAIDLFPQISELSDGERISEVGDCFSLLGRTFLVVGDLKKADEAAREAIKRITDQNSKDYADLQIVLGDLSRAKGDYAAAESFYSDVIRVAGTADAERSEIAARAYYAKGELTRSLHWFQKAAEIWERLEEDTNADRARWQNLKLGGRILSSATAVLESETPSVAVEVIRLYEASLAGMTGPARPRRSDPGTDYWRRLVLEARKNVAVAQVDW